jgi:hypothetical protein
MEEIRSDDTARRLKCSYGELHCVLRRAGGGQETEEKVLYSMERVLECLLTPGKVGERRQYFRGSP